MKPQLLIHGDSREELKSLEPNSIDIVLSDIPYNISFDEWDVLHQNKNSALLGSSPAQLKNASFKKRGKPINGWSKDDRNASYEYYEWCRSWIKELYRVTKEGSPILLFSSRRYLHRVASALEDEGFVIRDILIWEKDKAHKKAQRVQKVLERRGMHDTQFDNYRIGNLAPIFEPILFAMKPYKGTLTDCILRDRIGGFYCPDGKIPDNKFVYPANRKNVFHPTEKPVGLIKNILEVFSLDESHVILDPFMGGGSIPLGAKEMNRGFVGIEKQRTFFQTAYGRVLKQERMEIEGMYV
ncbi:site-specific DNA-methyltransferase (plasmid) [Aneurinibacillus sp. Ricciae_BoGa-3]|uniref:DNA-methyltransferase n=1 Tax=Aneurinibacillus sp. Ricciae_BoGa-3 TaxID=3022697 RepID=UPI0023419A7D|nr:site-specific DNA-methyltransferase [Aneurinibacillus sp. Ricciae_BoGa-3]WCK57742.1 site-specific DNA-methyltransferase [Aneurinibacillus sp. Ricciae_BoGa-3]